MSVPSQKNRLNLESLLGFTFLSHDVSPPMARLLRLAYKGAVYHVIVRGNSHQAISRDDRDWCRFLDLLDREVDQQQWPCDAYVS